MDGRARAQWKKADTSYRNYLAYLMRKRPKFTLTLVDLLHVRNFKGREASINEKEHRVNRKLRRYSSELSAISYKFRNSELQCLATAEVPCLKDHGCAFLKLTLDTRRRIDGFGPSRASALLHCHFPNLYPILDQNVLRGLGITPAEGQQATIEQYGALIDQCRAWLCEHRGRSIRNFDKTFFIRRLH